MKKPRKCSYRTLLIKPGHTPFLITQDVRRSKNKVTGYRQVKPWANPLYMAKVMNCTLIARVKHLKQQTS